MNIRMTDAIVHVVRCFIDDDIIHVDGNVDPLRDVEVISLELILADLSQIEKRLEKARKDKRADPIELAALEKVNTHLLLGKPARSAGLSTDELELIKGMMLLTLKPVIYAANVADSDLSTGNDMSRIVEKYAIDEGNKCVLVSAQVESELAGLDQESRNEFLADLGVSDEMCGLQALTRAAYDSLGIYIYVYIYIGIYIYIYIYVCIYTCIYIYIYIYIYVYRPSNVLHRWPYRDKGLDYQ
jgi:ribosome-binding ATPase YchF (GTP1/OBG family)